MIGPSSSISFGVSSILAAFTFMGAQQQNFLAQAQYSVAPDFSKLDKFADRLQFDYEIVDVETEDGF